MRLSMIRVELLREHDTPTGFRVTGHSGFERRGRDVVCAGVSAASHMAFVGLVDVLGEEVRFEKDDGYMTVTVPLSAASRPEVRALLRAFELEIQAIERSYPGTVELA